MPSLVRSNLSARPERLLDGSLELPPDGFRARRQYERILEECSASALIDDQRLWSTNPIVRDMVHALPTSAGQESGLGDYMTPAALRSLWHLCYGLPSLRRGRQGLMEMLVQKLRSSGGTIEDQRLVGQLDIRRKRVREVETRDGARFGTDFVVISGGRRTLSQLSGEEYDASPRYREMTVSVPASERPKLLQDPCAWVPEAGRHYGVRLDGDTMTVRWSVDTPTPDLTRLMPFADLAPGATQDVPGLDEPRLDDLELFGEPIRGPLKNVVSVGQAVLPGQGLESDCYTAYTAATILEKAATSRWPFGKNI